MKRHGFIVCFAAALAWITVTFASAQVPGLQNSAFFAQTGAPFPQVVNSNIKTGSGASTSFTANLPASIVAGNLLFVAVSSASATAPTLAPTGFTLLNTTASTHSSGTVIRRLSTYYKLATGSEGGTVSMTFASTVVASSVAYQIQGWGGAAPQVATVVGFGANPAPPSLTPSWGIKNTLWLVPLAINLTSGFTHVTSYPAGYVNGIDAQGGGTAQPVSAIASNTSAVATESPGTYSAPATADWVVSTVGVSP